MRKLDEICTDLREQIAGAFPVVRCSAAKNQEQEDAEIRAVSKDSLPAVVVFFRSANTTESGRIREIHLELVLFDRFSAGAPERTNSLLRNAERLWSLFPAGGSERNGIFYLPGEMKSENSGGDFLKFSIALLLRQKTFGE